MALYSKRAFGLICEQVNRDNPQLAVPVSERNITLLQGPFSTAMEKGRNTRVVVNGIPEGGYSGKQTLYYDRLNLTQLFKGMVIPVAVPFRAQRYREIVTQLSEACGLSLSVEDLGYPDSVFDAANLATGQRTVQIHANSAAFAGSITINFTRDNPLLTDLYQVTETSAWESPDIYTRVYQLDWTPYMQSTLLYLPLGTPIYSGINSYIANCVKALRAWTGIPFTLSSAMNDSPYELFGYVVTRENNPGLDLDMRGEFAICFKFTPPAAYGMLRQPFFLHMSRKDNTKYLTQEEDLRRYVNWMGFLPNSKTDLHADDCNRYVFMEALAPIGSDVMYGSPYKNRMAMGKLSRMIQHAYPTQADWESALAAKRPVLFIMGNQIYSSSTMRSGLNRNGYQSLGLNDVRSFWCTEFIYYDVAKKGYMTWNPDSATTPVAWYPPI